MMALPYQGKRGEEARSQYCCQIWDNLTRVAVNRLRVEEDL